jgi:hypothetical protein
VCVCVCVCVCRNVSDGAGFSLAVSRAESWHDFDPSSNPGQGRSLYIWMYVYPRRLEHFSDGYVRYIFILF